VAVQEDARIKAVAPYVSYRTFRNFFEHVDLVPTRVDRPLLSYTSGATQTQLLHAFRALGLTKANNDTTEEMETLADGFKAGDKGPLKRLLQRAYPLLFEPPFSLGRASQSQIREKFEEMGLSGDTIRKAQSFFIAAAKDAEFEVSPHLRASVGGSSAPRRPASANGGAQARRPNQRRRPADVAPQHETSGSGSGIKVPDALAGILKHLPAEGKPWSQKRRQLFMKTFEGALDLCYPLEDEEEVE